MADTTPMQSNASIMPQDENTDPMTSYGRHSLAVMSATPIKAVNNAVNSTSSCKSDKLPPFVTSRQRRSLPATLQTAIHSSPFSLGYSLSPEDASSNEQPAHGSRGARTKLLLSPKSPWTYTNEPSSELKLSLWESLSPRQQEFLNMAMAERPNVDGTITPRNSIVAFQRDSTDPLSPLESPNTCIQHKAVTASGAFVNDASRQELRREHHPRQNQQVDCYDSSVAPSIAPDENEEDSLMSFVTAAQHSCDWTSHDHVNKPPLVPATHKSVNDKNAYKPLAATLPSTTGVSISVDSNPNLPIAASPFHRRSDSPRYKSRRPPTFGHQSSPWSASSSTMDRSFGSYYDKLESLDEKSITHGPMSQAHSLAYTPMSRTSFSDDQSPCSTRVHTPVFDGFGSGGKCRRRQSRRLDSMTMRLPTPPSSLRKDQQYESQAGNVRSVVQPRTHLQQSPLAQAPQIKSATPRLGDGRAFVTDEDDVATASDESGARLVKCSSVQTATGTPKSVEHMAPPQICCADIGTEKNVPRDVRQEGTLETPSDLMAYHSSGLDPEFLASYSGPQELPTYSGRTILCAIQEEVVVSRETPLPLVSKLDELESLNAQLAFEKRVVEAKLFALRKAPEARLTPFQDVFDNARRLRAQREADMKRHKDEMERLKTHHAKELGEAMGLAALVAGRLEEAGTLIHALKASLACSEEEKLQLQAMLDDTSNCYQAAANANIGQ
ncbi:hypothetical protein MPSEU_000320000 [Mayamaea pseudoterrestris]|nr:hypothetical protein MPSEU_000320000 [Mayamaea pseudoterrestris]